jgi:hypothetical protein
MPSSDFSLKAIFINFYVGFLVLAHELYWLFGPGWVLHGTIKRKLRRVDVLRGSLTAGSNSELVEELVAQERALADLERNLDRQRAAHLEKMQQRIRIEN